MSDSLSTTSGDSRSDSRSDGSREDEGSTRVKGGAGGVTSFIRASQQQPGGLKALDKEMRLERCKSTQEAVFSGANPVPKPARSNRRLNSVPDEFTTSNQSNGDISRKVPRFPQSANAEQKQTADAVPPKPPRTGFTSPGDFLSIDRGKTFEDLIEGCEGYEEEREEEREEGEEWEDEGRGASSQSSSGSAAEYLLAREPQPPAAKRPMLLPAMAESPSTKRPMFPPPYKPPPDAGSDRTPSSSPASVRKEQSVSPKKEGSVSPQKGRSLSPQKGRSVSPSREGDKSPKNVSPKVPMLPPVNAAAKTPPTPTRTTPTSKRSPKSAPPSRPLPYAVRISREASAEKTDEDAPISDELKQENEKLRQQLRLLQQQLDSQKRVAYQEPVIQDPLAPEGGSDVFRMRSRSVSPGEEEDRDKFPSGNPRPAVTKPVPLPRMRTQTASSSQKTPASVFPPFSVPATVGFVTACGATETKEQERVKPKVPLLPPGSGSPIPKPRKSLPSPTATSSADHVREGLDVRPPAKALTTTVNVVESNVARSEVKSEVRREVKIEDKTKAILTLSKLLPRSNISTPLPLIPPIKPAPFEENSSRVSANPKTASPKTVSPSTVQSHSPRAIPIPRLVANTNNTPTPRSRGPRKSSDSQSGLPESASEDVASHLSTSVPPPSVPRSVQIKAPLNSVAHPVPSAAGKAKYKKVTLTDTSWIKRKGSLGNDSSDSAPATPKDSKPETGNSAVSSSSKTSGPSNSDSTPTRSSFGSNTSRSGSGSSTTSTPVSGSSSVTPGTNSVPFRSHPIMPAPKQVPQPFIQLTPPSLEPNSGKVSPPKVPDPPSRSRTDTTAATSKKKFWGKTPSDGEKKVQRRHALSRSTSTDDSLAPLQSDLNKAKPKNGGKGRKTLSQSQMVEPGSRKSANLRPVSMMVDVDHKREFTASSSSSMSPSMSRRRLAEDTYSKHQKKKSSGLLGRFKSKTTIQKHEAAAPEKPPQEDSGSDDEQGGTIKRMPKLRHVSSANDQGQIEDDSEPQYHQLFEYVFVVSLQEESKGKLTTKLTYTFPPTSGEFSGKDIALKSIPQFCFPDIDQWKPTKHYKSESYSFVLTDMEGNRRYGYCRRLLPAGTGPRLPEVFCIVSPLGCFSLYENILDQVEERREVSSVAVFNFLKAISANPFPRPGRSVEVKVFGARGSGMEAVTFTRP